MLRRVLVARCLPRYRCVHCHCVLTHAALRLAYLVAPRLALALQCFDDDLNVDAICIVEYAALGVGAGSSGLSVQITEPSGAQLYAQADSSSGKHAFTSVTDGKHTVCVTNAGSEVRRVALTVKSGVEANDYAAVAKKEHLEPLELELRRLEDSVKAIHAEYQYMREREEAMRDTNESTNSRVMWYSVFSIVVLASLAAWQLTYLKRYFKRLKIA